MQPGNLARVYLICFLNYRAIIKPTCTLADRRAMAKSRNPWLIYFAAFNALLAALITTSLVPTSQLLTLPRGSFFLGLALPGHFSVFALLLYFPLALVARLLRSANKLILPVAILYNIVFDDHIH